MQPENELTRPPVSRQPVQAGLVCLLIACLTALACMDDHGRLLSRNTFALVAGTCLVVVPAGTCLAWIIFRTDVAGRRMAQALVATLLFIPLYLQTAAWQAGFGGQGWWQLSFRGLGSPPLLDSWRGAIWVHAMAGLPWVTLITGLGFLVTPPELEESARLNGSWWQVVRKVSLPLSWTAIVSATIWVAVNTAGEITVTDVFQIRTYAEELFLGYAADALIVAPAEPARLRVLPGVVLIASATGIALLMSHYLLTHESWLSVRPAVRVSLGKRRWIVSLGLLLLLVLIVGVPICNLVTKLGIVVEQVADERVRRWSVDKALRVLSAAPGKFREELGWSLAIGNLASLAAVVVGTVLSWAARRSPTARVISVILLAICLAVPGPVVGLGLIRLLNQRDLPWMTFLYDRTILAPWLALTIRCFPLTMLVLWYGLQSLPRDIVEAARLDGAGIITTFTKVVFPLRANYFLCAWLVGLAVAIGDLSTSILVVPPGITTLAIRIFGLVHFGVEDQLAALCLCVIALCVMLAGVVVVSWRRNIDVQSQLNRGPDCPRSPSAGPAGRRQRD